jgi:hypothetical protein
MKEQGVKTCLTSMHKRTTLLIVAVVTMLSVAGAAGSATFPADASVHMAVIKAVQQPGGTAKSAIPDDTFWAAAVAQDPFTLTKTSKTIYAQGQFTGTGGNPTACALGVDLEEYDGYIKQWVTAAHQPMEWGKCSGTVNTPPYNCTYDPNTQWAYRTHIWLQAEKGSTYAPMDQKYSTNNVLYWCS